MTTMLPAPRTPHNGSGAHRPDTTARSFLEPGRRLSPSPRGDRPLRLLLTLLGAAVLVLLLLGMGTLSVSSWLSARGYTMVPATTELGTPSSLSLSNDVGDVRVEHSTEVDQVTLALVESGATGLPPGGDQVRARLDRSGDGESAQVDVNQPDGPGAIPWQDVHRDLLLLVPSGHELALDITSTVGDVDAEGEFSALSVSSEVGDVRLAYITAPDGLTATSDVGDLEVELESPTPKAVDLSTSVGGIDLLLPMDAGGEMTARSELGYIDITAPGSGRWVVDARSELGDAQVDPSMSAGSGAAVGTLTATSEVGDVTIMR